MLLQLSGNVYSHLLRLPVSWFEKRQVGDITSRMSTIESLKDLVSQGIVSVVIDSVSLILAALLIVGYSPRLSIVVFVFAALGVTLNIIASQLVMRRSAESLLATGVEQTNLIESIRAMATIVMDKENERLAKWRDLSINTINKTLSVSKVSIFASAINIAIVDMQNVTVLCLGAYLVQFSDGFSIGMLMAFYAFSQVFSDRLRSAAGYMIRFRMIGLPESDGADARRRDSKSGRAQ